MSASHEWAEWHLTPNGWIEGSYQLDFSSKVTVDSPKDRVLTCIYDEYLGSGAGKLKTTIREKWRSDDENKIKELLNKYKECPREL